MEADTTGTPRQRDDGSWDLGIPPRPLQDAITAAGGVCAPSTPYYDLFNPSAAATGPARPLTLRERLERYKNRKVYHLRRRVGSWVAGVPLDDHDPWD